MAAMIDDRENSQFHQILRDALRSDVPMDLDRDLWPRMRERLAAPPASPSLVDWALIVAIAGAAVLFPNVMLGVLYNL
jgi:hypothetical protein